jgi:SAM-dependent methyltransferase
MSGDAAPRYDEHAVWYHDWVPAPDDDFVARSLLGLVGEVRGERVLDLACGEGRIARALAGQGNEVVGVDLSTGLLGIARGKGGARVTYVHGDVCATDWWDGAPFDGVVASMSLMGHRRPRGRGRHRGDDGAAGRVVRLVDHPPCVSGRGRDPPQLAGRRLLRRAVVEHGWSGRAGSRRREPPDPVDLPQRRRGGRVRPRGDGRAAVVPRARPPGPAVLPRDPLAARLIR